MDAGNAEGKFMIETVFGLFGFVSMVTLAGICCSRYAGRMAIYLITRQGHRLESLRPACRAFKDEYSRSLEFQRLQNRVSE